MNVTELRIGNLVISRKGVSEKIVSIEIRNMAHHDYFYPIPLNKAWLIKAGFEFCFELLAYTHPKYPFTIYGNEFIVSSRGGYRDEYKSKIKFVHSLQNIFFALTGTELMPIDKKSEFETILHNYDDVNLAYVEKVPAKEGKL